MYLAENISLQSSNCNILGLAASMAFFAHETEFTQILVLFRACSLQNKVGETPFFCSFLEYLYITLDFVEKLSSSCQQKEIPLYI